ncbi:5 -methylthioadenosine S-adenosylhomocysteine nucleosidase, partial [Paramuricea clavata]
MSTTRTRHFKGPPPELSISIKALKDVDDIPIPWESRGDQSQVPTELLLMTATDEAFLPCYSLMEHVEKVYHNTLGFVYFGEFKDTNHKHQSVKVALMKHYEGVCETLKAVTNAAHVLHPKVTILVGTCETLERTIKVKPGDVVIATKLATYDDDRILPKVSRNVRTLILSAGHGWKPPLKDPESLKVKVKTALMISGSDKIKNRESLKNLQKDFPDALVIEDGGRGLYEAACDLKMEWAIVKGVSGSAGESEEVSESWKQFSSTMAASVVYDMFKYIVLQNWTRERELAGDTKDVSNAETAGSNHSQRNVN